LVTSPPPVAQSPDNANALVVRPCVPVRLVFAPSTPTRPLPSSARSVSQGRLDFLARRRHPLVVRQGRDVAASPPWLNIRGGDSTAAIRSTTSLKSAVFSAIDTFYKTMPLTSAFMTCSMKASFADWVAQKKAAAEVSQSQVDAYAEKDSIILGEMETPFEKRRNFAFFLYGGLYQGMAQEVRLNKIQFYSVLCASTLLMPLFVKVHL
ncbi:hypothetical protein ACHAWF_008413, partial [Thalassiosira exigua]